MLDLIEGSIMSALKGKVEAPGTSLQADAVMTVAIAATLSDGRLREHEFVRLRMLAYLNPMYARLKNVDEYIGSILEEVTREGQEDAVACASAALPPELRETAYAWAAEIAFCDGAAQGNKRAFLDRLRERLGIHGAWAGKIDAVTGIRNRSA